MFRGEFEHNIDQKGRVMIPIRFRATLGSTVVVGRGTLGQINIYPIAAFKAMEQQVADSGGADDFYFASLLMAAANDCELDRQGRIVLPPVLRRAAKLADEAIIIGNLDHIEIWNPDEWLKMYDYLVEGYRKREDNAVKLRELGVRM